jgi:hypothetical protein
VVHGPARKGSMMIRYLLAAACFVTISVAASAMSLDELKAASDCHALVVDPASALNLRRPPALRYRSPPLLICMPDDSKRPWSVAFAWRWGSIVSQFPTMALTQ